MLPSELGTDIDGVFNLLMVAKTILFIYMRWLEFLKFMLEEKPQITKFITQQKYERYVGNLELTTDTVCIQFQVTIST